MVKLDRKFPVYIPAGSQPSENEDPLLVKANTTNKALIEIEGKKLIEYVLEEINKSEYVDRIFIVGISEDDIDFESKYPVDFVPSVGSRMDTLRNMLKYLEQEYDELPDQMLILSADIPMITGKMIDTILEDLKDEYKERFEEIDYFYPIVPKKYVMEKFPEANKRYRKFTEGTFATGDFHVLSPKVLQNKQTMDTIEKIVESRKTMIRLLFRFDIFAPFKYMLGKLSARNAVIPFLNQELDVDIELMITKYPEIAIDLDYPDDLEMMKEFLKR